MRGKRQPASTGALTGSLTISIGRLTNDAPRPNSARRKALAITSEIAEPACTSAQYLVTGRNMLTVSMLWCVCFRLSARFTAPAEGHHCVPSEVAVASPVIRLSCPARR